MTAVIAWAVYAGQLAIAAGAALCVIYTAVVALAWLLHQALTWRVLRVLFFGFLTIGAAEAWIISNRHPEVLHVTPRLLQGSPWAPLELDERYSTPCLTGAAIDGATLLREINRTRTSRCYVRT